MNSETRAYIEQHISSIETNIAAAYRNCPLRILNDFNNSMHIAGIEYPPEVHNYVVVCCYMCNRFKDVRLQSYDFEYGSEKEEYSFTCKNCLYDATSIQHSLSQLLSKRTVVIETRSVLLCTSNTLEEILKIRVKVS